MSFKCQIFTDLNVRDLSIKRDKIMAENLLKPCETMPIIDTATPINLKLSAMFKRSFAYFTVKERLPVIITKIIDQLARDRDAILVEYGAKSEEDIRSAMSYLVRLRNEIMTNKQISDISTTAADSKVWNGLIRQHDSPYYFTAVWLFTECYVYRRIREAFELTLELKNFDPFRKQKEQQFINSIEAMCYLSNEMIDTWLGVGDEAKLKEDFVNMFKICLWSNKCDLSLSAGADVDQSKNPIKQIKTWDDNIIINDLDNLFEYLKTATNSHRDKTSQSHIDIICDNAGYELFTDLCMADFLITRGFCSKVRFRIKAMPWFVSDAMPKDFEWTISNCCSATCSAVKPDNLIKLGHRWMDYLKNGLFEYVVDEFWTTPYDYSEMRKADILLYKSLSEAIFLIFKGDLNYRKLMGENNWNPTTAFTKALQGFHPSPLCTIRTVKADLICGLKEGQMAILNEIDEKWMETGNFGLIQACNRVVQLTYEELHPDQDL